MNRVITAAVKDRSQTSEHVVVMLKARLRLRRHFRIELSVTSGEAQRPEESR